MEAEKQELKGIGGWLILFVALQVVNLLEIVRWLYFAIFSFFEASWPYKAVIILIVLNGLLIMNLLSLIFNESKTTVKWGIITIWFGFLVHLLTPSIIITPLVLAVTIAWTAYFLKSERVKNTFTKDASFKF